MDVRCDYDDREKVCSPQSANTWWGIRTNWRRAINTWTLPSCAGKILWLQALKYPVESELTSFIQSRSSLDAELLQGKDLPWGGTSRRAGNAAESGLPGSSTAACEEPLTFSSVSAQSLDPWSRLPQPCWAVRVQLLELGFGNPCLKLLIGCCSPWSPDSEWRAACIVRSWELSIHLFYLWLVRTTFYKMPCFLYYCFGKESFMKIVLVWK